MDETMAEIEQAAIKEVMIKAIARTIAFIAVRA